MQHQCTSMHINAYQCEVSDSNLPVLNDDTGKLWEREILFAAGEMYIARISKGERHVDDCSTVWGLSETALMLPCSNSSTTRSRVATCCNMLRHVASVTFQDSLTKPHCAAKALNEVQRQRDQVKLSSTKRGKGWTLVSSLLDSAWTMTVEVYFRMYEHGNRLHFFWCPWYISGMFTSTFIWLECIYISMLNHWT